MGARVRVALVAAALAGGLLTSAGGAAVASPRGISASENVIIYSGNPGVTDTGINIAGAQPVTVSAVGDTAFAANPPSGCGTYCATDPNGEFVSGLMTSPSDPHLLTGTPVSPATQVTCTTGCYLDGGPVGALVGRIGPIGPWFVVGTNTTLGGPGGPAGELYLAYNDGQGAYFDNLGQIDVTLTGAFRPHIVSTPVLPVVNGSQTVAVNAGDPVPVLTGLRVDRGHSLQVTATGTSYFALPPLSGCGTYCTSTPDGFPAPCAADCVLPGAPVGALLGRVGAGPWFVLGNSATVTAAEGLGSLSLVYNDDFYPDNDGSYAVTVTSTLVPPRP